MDAATGKRVGSRARKEEPLAYIVKLQVSLGILVGLGKYSRIDLRGNLGSFVIVKYFGVVKLPFIL